MKKQLLFLSTLLLFTTATFAQDGMSIGTNATPLEMLDVNGAIKLGNDFNGGPGAPLGGKGTIRWNNTDGRFEGWDGFSWVLLSSAGTDDQNLTGAVLTGSSLEISIENGNSATVSLASLDQSGAITTVTNALNAHITADGDLSSTNEIQSLSISGSDITLSLGGGSVTIPAGADNLGNHSASQLLNMNSFRITGLATPTAATDAATKAYVDAHTDADSDPTNEIQTAAQVAVTPSGNLTSTNVQAALQELQGDINGIKPTIANVLTNGNIANAGQHMRIDKVRAIGADGLFLTDDADKGIFIRDGGNVGIGTTAPTYLLDVKGAGVNAGPISAQDNIMARFEQNGTATGAGIQIKGTRNTAGNVASFVDLMNYASSTSYIAARIAAERGAGEAGSLLFYTNDGTGIAEKMRIKSTGVVQVGNLATGGTTRYVLVDNLGNLSFSTTVPPATAGTVTSVSAGNLSPLFTTTVATPSTTPAFSFTAVDQAANAVFVGPASGADAAPTFRALVAADIPNLDAVKITTGTLPIERGGTNSSTALTGNKVMVSNAGGTAIVVNTATMGASLPVFTDANGLPTTAVPVTGVQGYWTRPSAGILHNSTLGDKVGIGTDSPLGTLDAKGAGSTSSSYGFGVRNSADTYSLVVRDDGNVGIGNTAPSAQLDVESSSTTTSAFIAKFSRNQVDDGWIGITSNATAGHYNPMTSNGDKGIYFSNDNVSTTADNSGLLIAPHSTVKSGLKIMENGNVGIGVSDPQAALDVVSTTQGFAMPRMTTAQRKAISAPIAGLQVYDINLKGFYYYDGSKWDCVNTPAGTVNYFGSNTVPNGYLACNGAAVSRTTYAELFAAIGTTYGPGNGSTTFNLPELRGEFIRGWDNGRGVDSGRSMASTQADAFKAHNHTFANQTWGGQTTAPRGVSGNTSTADGDLDGSRVITGYDRASVSLIINNTGGTETRPRNVALLAVIKY